MARYRHTWATDYGWNLRLDIIPYDGTLDETPTALDAGTVLGIGPLEMSFDELPVGLMHAPTMSVTLNWTRLPSALQTRLANMTNGNDRFCFLFFTDRGTSGATYTLEFCGTLANEETADFDPVINDEGILTDDYQITLDLVDCLHHIMSSTNGTIFDGALWAASDTTRHKYVFDYRVSSSTVHMDFVGDNNLAEYCNLSSWAHCMARMRTSLSAVFNGQYARTSNATELADDDAADRTLEWDTFITTGATFAQRGIGATAGATLDEDTAYLITHVYAPDGTVVGGLWDNSDEYGWYSASAVLDLVKDFCETFAVKASYYPEYVTDAGGDYVRYTWNIAAVGDSTDAFTSALATDLTKALSIGTVSQGSTTIQKAETRFDLHSAKYNYDVTEYVSIDARSRSTRSFNFEPILHNTPGYKPKLQTSNGLYEFGLYQTNRIFALVNNYPIKAHEQTTVNLSNLSGITSVIAFSEARPPFNQSSNGDTLADNERDHGVFTAWLNTAQQASSPCSVAKAYRTAFSSGFQCSLEVDYPITYSNNVRPHRFAWVHNLSGGPASVFTHLPWSRACITGMSCDYTTGTNTITYVLLKLS